MASNQLIYPSVTLIIGESPLARLEGDHRYFAFSQNNSGGGFHRDENYGEYVVIAAKDADHANDRVQEIGVYFNGCDSERDCSCCGDRWYAVYGEGDLTPQVYGKRPEAIVADDTFFRMSVVVHHADGTRETYSRVDDKKR